MNRKPFLVLTLLAVTAVAVVSAQTRRPSPGTKIQIPAGSGIVQYDPGAPSDVALGQLGPSVTIGNRFSSRNGSPLSPGSVSFVSFYLVGNAGVPVFVDFWGAPTGGGGAPSIASFFLSPIANSTFNVFSVGPVGVPSDFLAGVYLPNSPLGEIGMRTATTNGQGFHGMQISFAGGAGTNYGSLQGLNAMFRVAGDIIVPVELMEFDVD